MKSFLLLSFLLFIASCSYAASIEEIKAKYSNIRTFNAKFTQEIQLASIDTKREFSGEVYFKRGRGFLWIYKKPRLRYFLFDGSFLYQVDEEKPYVVKEKFDPSKSQGYFLDLLEDIKNLDRHFKVRRVRSSENEILIELEPKENSALSMVTLRLDNSQTLLGLEILERTGNKNSFKFTSVVLDGEIPDHRFVFKMPKDKELLERFNDAPKKR